ncbi:hypothetical protein NIES2101_36135 [Calothrix sp. HK-06]|nr:hypothetical protein NIES2101_36135 [Calothrix sp. HK-06]
METRSNTQVIERKLEQIGNILRLAGWIGFWVELGFAVAGGLTLLFAITGRSFNQTITPVTPVPGAAVNYTQSTTPGLGIGIFWAGCGILLLLFNVYLAFRQTRLARRLRNGDISTHPKKSEVMQIVRWGIIASLVGMLATIIGGGITLAVLLAKSIAVPQGVAVIDPNRIIRALDIFVALANMNGITGNFVGLVAGLGILNWLYRE